MCVRVNVCACVHICVATHVGGSEDNLRTSVLTFHFVGSGDRI